MFPLSIPVPFGSSSTLPFQIPVPLGRYKGVVPSSFEAATCNPLSLVCKADERQESSELILVCFDGQ